MVPHIEVDLFHPNNFRKRSRSQPLADVSTPGHTGRGTGPDGSNKRSSERTAEDGTERSDVGSPRAAGYVRGGAPDEIMGGAGERTAKPAERSSARGRLRIRPMCRAMATAAYGACTVRIWK